MISHLAVSQHEFLEVNRHHVLTPDVVDEIALRIVEIIWSANLEEISTRVARLNNPHVIPELLDLSPDLWIDPKARVLPSLDQNGTAVEVAASRKSRHEALGAHIEDVRMYREQVLDGVSHDCGPLELGQRLPRREPNFLEPLIVVPDMRASCLHRLIEFGFAHSLLTAL